MHTQTMRLSAILMSLIAATAAQADENEQLAKQLANPVASLISVPLQFNYDGGIGPTDGDRFYMNIQPVIPFELTEDWNVISRTILPVVYQSDIIPGDDQFGLGDTVQSLFFSPKLPTANGVIWGAGPVFLLPTATDDALGAEKWGAGPTAVVLKQDGAWTFGGLTNHIWSFAGDDDRGDVNATFLQPFVVYTTPKATSFFLNLEATYDWEREQSSVPVNAGVNQLFNFGGQLVQLGAGVRYWIDSPESGPEGFGARINAVFLFPR